MRIQPTIVTIFRSFVTNKEKRKRLYILIMVNIYTPPGWGFAASLGYGLVACKGILPATNMKLYKWR